MPFSRLAALLLVEVLVLQLLPGAPAIADDDEKADGNERFKWLGKTWEMDLSRGYHLKAASWRLFLERQPDGQSKFEYVVLPPKTLSEFQDAVNDAASRGFRLKPETVNWASGAFSRVKVRAVLEKARSSSSVATSDLGARYEYRFSDPSEKAIAKRASEGFQVIHLPEGADSDGYSRDFAVLERRTDKGGHVTQQPLARERYKLLKDERALDGPARAFTEHVRNGYRLAFVSQSQQAILLEQGPDQSPRPDYTLIRNRFFLRRQQSEDMMRKLEHDLNEAALLGYQLLPNGVFFGDAGGRTFAFNEYVAILERSHEPTPVQYRVVLDLTELNKAAETEMLSIVGILRSGIIAKLPRK